MPVAVGVVGAGTVADRHLSAARRSPHSRLVAVCDRDRDRAAGAAAEYGIDHYADVKEMLAATDLDLVHVCTPIRAHFPVARAAITDGVGVLIEKPATETVSEVERLQDLARRHDVPATVVHQSQFSPAMRRARGLVADGQIGAVRGVDLIYTGGPRPNRTERGDWVFDLPGGEFEETIPHPIYLGLNGGYPRSQSDITAVTTRMREYDREIAYDAATVVFVTEAGGLASLTLQSGGHASRLLHLHGEAGTITVDVITQTVFHADREYLRSSTGRARKSVDETVTNLWSLAANANAVLQRELRGGWEREKGLDPHLYQIDETYRAIEAGTTMPIPMTEAKWTVTVLAAIRSAADATTRDER